MNCRFRIALIPHLALFHAYEVGAEYSAQSGNDTRDDLFLRGGQRLLQDLVDNVHDVFDRRSDVRRVRVESFVGVER